MPKSGEETALKSQKKSSTAGRKSQTRQENTTKMKICSNARASTFWAMIG